MAVVKTGGKQYLVRENQELIVDRLSNKEKEKIKLITLASFDEEKDTFELGAPTIKTQVEAEVVNHLQGDKLRISRFKSKVRYRRVKGFRPQLTKIRITKI